MSFKVLVPQPIAVEAVEALKSWGYEIVEGSGASEEALLADVEDCDAILLRTAPVTRRVLEKGKKLKIVARHGAGYNNVDFAAAEELGVWVTNAPDSTTDTVAEFTIGAILAAAKAMFPLADSLKRGDFYFKNGLKGIELRGKTLGIVGLGRIGRRVAQIAHFGLDMRILAYSPHATAENSPEYVRLMSMDELFAESDFVSLHIPLTEANRRCIGREQFEKMKPEAFFINCARGEVVDQEALIEIMREHKIAGAFLDVIDTEPFDLSCPLLNMDNVVVTPHIASNTEECMCRMATQAASQIHKVLSGELPDWPVNSPVANPERFPKPLRSLL